MSKLNIHGQRKEQKNKLTDVLISLSWKRFLVLLKIY